MGGGALLEEASAFKKYFGPGPRPARVAINLRGFINQELTLRFRAQGFGFGALKASQVRGKCALQSKKQSGAKRRITYSRGRGGSYGKSTQGPPRSMLQAVGAAWPLDCWRRLQLAQPRLHEPLQT